MFNKNFIAFKANIFKTINDFSSIVLYRKNIKHKITHAMRMGEKCAMWFKSYPEAFDGFEMCVAEYLEDHKEYIKNKGFNIKSDEDCVEISW